MQLRAQGPSRGALAKPCRVHQRLSHVAPIRAVKVEKETKKKQAEEDHDEHEVLPTTQEVKNLLTVLTDQTEFAELKLNMGSFRLTVRRDLADTPLAPAAAPATAAAPSAVSVAPQPTMAPALSLAPVPYMSVDYETADDSLDEALVYCTAPKVGVFRRGRYAGGKRVGKGNLVDLGDQVRKGQTLGWIEQLGTFVEVKSPQGGEIVEFKADEGEPIEYMQTLIAISPFFGVQEVGVTEHRFNLAAPVQGLDWILKDSGPQGIGTYPEHFCMALYMYPFLRMRCFWCRTKDTNITQSHNAYVEELMQYTNDACLMLAFQRAATHRKLHPLLHEPTLLFRRKTFDPIVVTQRACW